MLYCETRREHGCPTRGGEISVDPNLDTKKNALKHLLPLTLEVSSVLYSQSS